MFWLLLLVERSKIVFPPLHIKLGIMRKDGDCFRYICMKFPSLTIEKVKAGIFDGPQIWKLMNDSNFCNFMNPAELSAWMAFTNVVKFFLGKTKAPNYKRACWNITHKSPSTGCKHEHQVTFFAQPSCPFSRKSRWCERRARGALSSRHQRHGSSLSRSLGWHHACRLLLDYQARWCQRLPF